MEGVLRGGWGPHPGAGQLPSPTVRHASRQWPSVFRMTTATRRQGEAAVVAGGRKDHHGYVRPPPRRGVSDCRARRHPVPARRGAVQVVPEATFETRVLLVAGLSRDSGVDARTTTATFDSSRLRRWVTDCRAGSFHLGGAGLRGATTCGGPSLRLRSCDPSLAASRGGVSDCRSRPAYWRSGIAGGRQNHHGGLGHRAHAALGPWVPQGFTGDRLSEGCLCARAVSQAGEFS